VFQVLADGPWADEERLRDHDSGLAACAYPLTAHHVTAAEYRQIRAQFAGSRWPDLRTAGTDYADLAVRLLTARGTDGYETVWFYQRLAAACAEESHPGGR
jgi:hypothetical protein